MITRHSTRHSAGLVAAGGVLALALAATALTGTASAAGGPTVSAQGQTQGQTQGQASPADLGDSPGAVCAANAGPPNQDGITAQDYGAGFDPLDTWGAADLRVTATCKVSTVEIPGITNGGPASGITISFHEGSPSNPAQCLTSRRAAGPNFTVNVGRCTLKPGKVYWLVVQVSQRFDPSGQWFWATTNQRFSGLDQWKNPGDGFATGCTGWDTLDSCLDFAYDYLFTVKR